MSRKIAKASRGPLNCSLLLVLGMTIYSWTNPRTWKNYLSCTCIGVFSNIQPPISFKDFEGKSSQDGLHIPM
jgi:hypothetical protein